MGVALGVPGLTLASLADVLGLELWADSGLTAGFGLVMGELTAWWAGLRWVMTGEELTARWADITGEELTVWCCLTTVLWSTFIFSLAGIMESVAVVGPWCP
jgi:hypothetical protein